MARNKATGIQPSEDVPLNATALTIAANQMSEHAHLVVEKFGDGLPYERERIIHEAQFYMAQSASSMLEAGKRLILLKECEPHGEFTRLVEEQLGLSYFSAAKIMQAAVKFCGGTDRKPALNLVAAAGNKSKLLELMILDDEQIAELNEGGTVAGLDLDDVDRMSVRELKLALREAREEGTAKDEVIAGKNQKIDQLDTKLRLSRKRIKDADPDTVIAEIRREATIHATEAEVAVRGNLAKAIEALQLHGDTHGVDHGAFMAGLLIQIERAVNELRETYAVPEQIDGSLVPHDMRG